MARNFTLTRTLTLMGLLSSLTLNLTPALAAPMGPTQVSAMAASWAARSAGFQDAQISSVHALAWEAAEPAFYLVSLNQGGWILASGDDALRPVVGWSTAGLLDGELPPALETRLQEEEREVLNLRAAGTSCAENQAAWTALLRNRGQEITALRTSPGDVEPMLTATWGQGSLYNTDCPADNAGPGGHVFVGCVGVAIAQVLEYWNWPQQGEFVQSYYHETYGEISVDFNQEFYNWDAITPTTVNADVKELLYHAGVSVRMNYGPSSSSAQSSMISTALRAYFRYQDAARMVWRSSYTAETWRTMLHAELSAGRPVIYRGQGPNGGHAYDVDGVQDSTWFHINWGWSGSYNGYFLLDDLSPGNYYFGDVQGAVIGIAPDGMSVNHQPVVASLQSTIQDGETARVTLSGYDADGDKLSYSVDGRPIEGQVWSWQPRAGKCGTYVFSYQACDQYGCGQPAELIVIVQDDDPPHRVEGQGPNEIGIDTLSTRPDGPEAPLRPQESRLNGQPIKGSVQGWSPPQDPGGDAALANQRDSHQPVNAGLRPAYPNPFNPGTTLPIELSQSGHVRLSIYNVNGQRVALLLEGTLAAGHHELRWSTGQLASGVYLAVLESSAGPTTQLLQLLR